MRKIFYLTFFSFFLTGCANYSYIRSDIMLDKSSVSKIYTMPMMESIQIDGVYLKKSQKKDQILSKIDDSLGLILDHIENNLSQKGYDVKVDRRRFIDLGESIPEQAFKESIFAASRSVIYEDVDIKVNNGVKERSFKVSGESDVKSSDILIDKTLRCFSKVKIDADTVMYVYIDSFLAQRIFWFIPSEKSYLTYKIDMVSLKKKEVFFSFKRRYKKTDLLTRRKMLQALDDMLNNIPMRL